MKQKYVVYVEDPDTGNEYQWFVRCTDPSKITSDFLADFFCVCFGENPHIEVIPEDEHFVFDLDF